MAFCSKCGKALQEGEVCSCETNQAQTPSEGQAEPRITIQPSAVSEMFKELGGIALGVLKAPAESIQAFVKKADIKVAGILIGLHAIVAALIKWFELLRLNSGSGNINNAFDYLMGMDMSDLLNLGSSGKISGGKMFTEMLQSAINVIASAAIVALIIMLLVNLFAKTKTTYMQGLSIASLTAILSIPALIISWLFGFIDASFFANLANWVTEFATVAGIVFIVLGVRTVSDKDNKLPLIVGASSVCSVICLYIIAQIF